MSPPRRIAGLDAQALALKTLLGGPAFVRRDRSGRALFVSDAPRRLGADAWEKARARLEAAGCTLELSGGLAFIGWDIGRSRAFCRGLDIPAGWEGREDSLSGFCRVLARQRTAFEEGMLPHFHRCLLLWDGGQEEALRLAAETALAGVLRERRPLPAYLLPLLLTLPERRTPC